MPGGQYDLFEKKISATYHRVVQYESGSGIFLDGRGDALPAINWVGDQIISGSLTTTGTIFANRLIVSQSIIENSGSTQWGDTLDDTHKFIGNVYVSGSIIRSNKTITSDYNALVTDKVILANTISNFSASLYDAEGQDGNSLIFKVIGNGNLTIRPQSGQVIDEQNNLIITDKFVSVELFASGSNWYII